MDNATLTVDGILNITGVVGAAGSQTSIYQYSSYNHALAEYAGFGRTNVSCANTVLLAADTRIVLESDDTINQNCLDWQAQAKEKIFLGVGDYNANDPIPSQGYFEAGIRVGGYSPADGTQQPGRFSLMAGEWMNINAPSITIGNQSYGHMGANTTSNILLYAATEIELRSPNVVAQQDIILGQDINTVSYTHLTLPTILLV